MRGLLSLAFLALMFIAPVQAQTSFSGIYVGGEAQWSTVDASLGANVQGFGNIAQIDGLSAKGVQGNGFVGYQAQFGSVVFGLEGGYGAGKSNFDLDVIGTNLLHASLQPTYFGDLKLGWVHQSTLFYGAVGYQAAELEVSSPFFATQQYDLHGLRLGAGIDHKLDKNWALGLRVTHIRYQSEDLLKGNALPLSLDAELAQTTVGVRLTFYPFAK